MARIDRQMRLRGVGWRGVCLVGITYVYFLIFAQFAFLKRLAALGIADAHLKAVMAAMAFGGILLSLLAPRVARWNAPNLRLRIALLSCGAAAFLCLLPLGLAAVMAVSLLIGCGLGLLTVTLVTHLRLWIGETNPLLAVGLGTGVGYFVCNVPVFFAAAASTQAAMAGGLCLGAVFLTHGAMSAAAPETQTAGRLRAGMSFSRVLVSLTALVWLDSAAFFIVQNTPALKAGTWEGSAHLWANGALHFAAALAGVWVLSRRGLGRTLIFAFAALAVACLLLSGERVLLGSLFYPVGVSLYSVALVAYPAVLSPAGTVAERGRRAGWIYAIAGWFGSAMGIGMGQNLGHVPAVFVGVAAVVVLGPELAGIFRQRRREVLATGGLLFAALVVEQVMQRASGQAGGAREAEAATSPVERGRIVYTSEGCIHCHSQYVRPNSPDVLLWGPVKTVDELRKQPVAIGNRRQGPDLAEVGSRRSPLWLRMHFYHPAEVSYRSIMPSYGYLFKDRGVEDGGVEDTRGDDLIAYLESLRGGGVAEHRAAELSWRPSEAAMAYADFAAGGRLFGDYCGTCHFSTGQTRVRWQGSFRRLPPEVSARPRAFDAVAATPERLDRLARIAKFGVPGTDMAGHEYLSDEEILSISRWLARTTDLAGDSIASSGRKDPPVLNEQPVSKEQAKFKDRSGERP